MYYNLFLDDERFPCKVSWINLPPVQWEIVRNYSQFIQIITERGLPEHISYDHDLSDYDATNAGKGLARDNAPGERPLADSDARRSQ